jgi:hypothetical protein
MQESSALLNKQQHFPEINDLEVVVMAKQRLIFCVVLKM